MPNVQFGQWHMGENTGGEEVGDWFEQQNIFFELRTTTVAKVRAGKAAGGAKRKRNPRNPIVKERRNALSLFRALDSALVQLRGEGSTALGHPKECNDQPHR